MSSRVLHDEYCHDTNTHTRTHTHIHMCANTPHIHTERHVYREVV